MRCVSNIKAIIYTLVKSKLDVEDTHFQTMKNYISGNIMKIGWTWPFLISNVFSHIFFCLWLVNEFTCSRFVKKHFFQWCVIFAYSLEFSEFTNPECNSMHTIILSHSEFKKQEGKIIFSFQGDSFVDRFRICQETETGISNKNCLILLFVFV